MKKLGLFLTLIFCVLLINTNILAQNGTLTFGDVADNTTATTANTGFGGVRVGSGGGGFTLQNPGQTIGELSELRGVAPTGGSINSVGITSTEYGTAAQLFTVSFDVYFSGGNSGTWYFFNGNGTTFGATQSNTFTGNQVFTGLRFVYGANDSLIVSNRSGAAWVALTTQPLAQNTAYNIRIVGNNTNASANYGSGQSVATNTYDLYVNGLLVGDDLSKAQLPNATNVNAFRFYGESSTGNVANIALDNVSWFNTLEAPSDTTAPETTILTTPTNPTTSTDATFTFSSSEANSTFSCSLDGAPATPCTSPTNYTGLAVGQRTFTVFATDEAGNPDTTPASYSWTINAASEIDLTISRTGEDVATNANTDFDYTITVSNGGSTAATGVKATFQIPNGLNYVSATGGGGFTPTQTGSLVTFDGGTVGPGGSVNLVVTVSSPVSGVLVTSLGLNVAVDPDGAIAETNETNNNATDNLDLRIQFQSPVIGLGSRPNLATLLNDIANIGINADNNSENIVRLNTSLTGENTDIVVPSNIILDFENFNITGTANITFEGNSGFNTANGNGLGNAENPGSIQLSGTRTFDGAVDARYYSVTALPGLGGGAQQRAYGHPSLVDDFEVDNLNGIEFFAPFRVNGQFFLTNGVINNGSNTITLSETTSNNGNQNSGGSQTSYVSGKVEKLLPTFGAPNGLASFYIFPIGAGTGYSPVRVDYNTVLPGSSLTIQAFDTNFSGILSPSLSRYWQIDETGDVNVDLQFDWRDEDDSALTPMMDLDLFRGTLSACTAGVTCTVDLAANTATIQSVSNFSPWTVAEAAATAANSEVSGKVTDARGNAIANARVAVIDQNGAVRTVRTNNFGNYTIDGIESGRAYTFTVESRENTFAPQLVTVQDNINNLNFSAID